MPIAVAELAIADAGSHVDVRPARCAPRPECQTRGSIMSGRRACRSFERAACGPVLDGRAAQPDLLPHPGVALPARARRSMRRTGADSGRRQCARATSRSLTFSSSPRFELDGAVFMREHAVARGHAHGAAIRRAHAEQLLLSADDGSPLLIGRNRIARSSTPKHITSPSDPRPSSLSFAARVLAARDHRLRRPGASRLDGSMNSPMRTMRVPCAASRTNT